MRGKAYPTPSTAKRDLKSEINLIAAEHLHMVLTDDQSLESIKAETDEGFEFLKGC